MNQKVKKIIRSHCPDSPLLRKTLTAIKLGKIMKYRVKPEDIAAGEQDWEQKKKIVEKYTEKWPSYIRELNKKFEEYVGKSGLLYRKNDIEALRIKAVFDCCCYGFLPDEFFVYRLSGLSFEEKTAYISNRDKDLYSYQMNDIIEMDIFFDKYRTYQKFRLYYGREAAGIEKPEDFAAFQTFVKKHPVFVRKNVMLSRGESVELLDITQSGRTVRELFDEMVAHGKYIVEERVVQSAAMSRLNPDSVNTVRCTTFLAGDKVQIGPCFLKVGRESSFIDNGAAGGILIGIEPETGKLDTAGYDEFLNVYEKHPDTQVVFKGYQMPDWEVLQALARELSGQIPKVRYISWDFAHTGNGWVIIEGNASGQFIGPQIVWQRGFKKEIQKLAKGVSAEGL